VVITVLKVKHSDYASSAHQWNREKGFVTVFRELVEKLEAGIVCGTLGNGDGFKVLGDPSGNSLPDAELQTIDNFRMRVFGSPKDEFVAFQHIDKAGVTLYEGSGKIYNTGKNLMKAIGGTQTDRDFMKDINVRVFYR